MGPTDWRDARKQEREKRRDERRRQHEERHARQREHWERFWGGHGPDSAGRQLMGILLIAVGGLFVLSNLEIIHVQDFWDFWPVILIVMGLSYLSRWRAGHFPVGGFVLTGLGAAFLLRNLGLIQVSIWRYFWPAMLILWGVSMLYRRREEPALPDGTGRRSLERIDEWVMFSGVHRKIDSQAFEGGNAFALFGGVELDLRKAATKLDEVVIEASAMFGGVEIIAPENWNVSVTGTAIFGGYEDETVAHPVTEERRPRLVVTGNAMFGGVSVKN